MCRGRMFILGSKDFFIYLFHGTDDENRLAIVPHGHGIRCKGRVTIDVAEEERDDRGHMAWWVMNWTVQQKTEGLVGSVAEKHPADT